MTYEVKCDEPRMLYKCAQCSKYYAETKGTPIERLRTPISEISLVLNALNEGTGINAATRLFGFAKNTIYLWIERFASLKETLMLYALCHQFIQLQIEGDEIYTKIENNKPPMDSEGWTILLMDRASRFIWEINCGEKTELLFLHAMETLAQVIAQTDELSLFTDGERQYGNLLFAICRETFHTGESGRPPSVLPKGVTVRIKNKGNQSHQPGPKRPKYQAPWREHPDTDTQIDAITLRLLIVLFAVISPVIGGGVPSGPICMLRLPPTYKTALICIGGTISLTLILPSALPLLSLLASFPILSLGALSPVFRLFQPN